MVYDFPLAPNSSWIFLISIESQHTNRQYLSEQFLDFDLDQLYWSKKLLFSTVNSLTLRIDAEHDK